MAKNNTNTATETATAKTENATVTTKKKLTKKEREKAEMNTLILLSRKIALDLEGPAMDMGLDSIDAPEMRDWIRDQLHDAGMDVDASVAAGEVVKRAPRKPAAAAPAVPTEGSEPQQAASEAPAQKEEAAPAAEGKEAVEKKPRVAVPSPHVLSAVWDLVKRDGGDEAKAEAAMTATVQSWPVEVRRRAMKKAIGHFNGPSAKSPFGEALRRVYGALPAEEGGATTKTRTPRSANAIKVRGNPKDAYLVIHVENEVAAQTLTIGSGFKVTRAVVDGAMVITLTEEKPAQ